MTKKYIKGSVLIMMIIVIALTLLVLLFTSKTAAKNVEAEEIATSTSVVDPIAEALSHRQETWLSALEWCESRGVKTAINRMDRDGTPSYYSFQFKPSTFRYYGEMYSLLSSTTPIMEAMTDYDLARDIVRHMVLDNRVNFRQQFPDCVNNKIGLPPRI